MNTNESSWKPSDGQLECLEYAINNAEKDYSPLAGNRIYLTLKALKKQLEKIKNENIVMEDYKEKYNKLVEAVKALQEANPSDEEIRNWVNNNVPELKEHEDKRIKTFIKGLLLPHIYDIDVVGDEIKPNKDIDIYRKALTWLEKQGEPTTIDIDKMVLKYSQTRESCTNGLPVNCQIRAYRQGINDTLRLSFNLEKQDEQKVSVDDFKAKNWYVSEVDGKIHDMTYNPADNVESKFKVGDWITNSIETVQITGYDIDYGYQVDCKGNLQHRDTDIIEKEYHLWTIQDAKEGDVLASSKSIFIFKGIYMAGKPESYCAIMNGYFFCCSEGCWTNEQCYPATKEERNILFQKMKEAGFEWDSEKKELKLVITNGGDFEPELSHKEVSKKSEQDDKWKWDEDDEKFFRENILIGLGNSDDVSEELYNKIIDWLDLIKKRLS